MNVQLLTPYMTLTYYLENLKHSNKNHSPFNGFSIKPTCPSEVEKFLLKLNFSSASGVSCIFTRIIKACAREKFNNSLLCSSCETALQSFLDDWKKSIDEKKITL